MLPPAAGAVTVKVIAAVPLLPATADGNMQLTKAPAALSGVQLAPLAPVAIMPAGNWSCTTTPAALAVWPLLVTVKV